MTSTRTIQILRVALLLLLLYTFFLALDLLGFAFKSFGRDFAEQLVAQTSNPFVGLLIGILATSLVQSSSATTSMTVALVAAGGLTIEGAVPVIMGANIGTSVTNTVVSLAHAGRRDEFRRAFSAATVHDFFNWLSVLIILPLEITTGYLRKTAAFLELALEGSGGLRVFNPVKAIVAPVSSLFSGLLGENGVIILVLAGLLLFLALKSLVSMLRVLVTSKAETILHRTLFRSPWHALAAGALITAMVQSSSITTSTMIPLVGAGVVTLEQALPYTLGANIGTTLTPILAALSTGNPAALTVGLAHLVFNITGTALIYPIRFMRRIPLTLARRIGALGARNRIIAGTYIIFAFYVLPILLLALSGGILGERPAEDDHTSRLESTTSQAVISTSLRS